MRVLKIKIIILVLISLFVSTGILVFAASDDSEKLGDEFQKQAPWFREKQQSGESRGEPQPELYLKTPEEKKEKEDKYPYCYYPYCQEQYTLCYNSDTGRYEYCYPSDSYYFKLRFQSPKFRLWWEQERMCPPGYFFKPSSGCVRFR